MPDAFGPLFVPAMLEDDVEMVLRRWMTTAQARVMAVMETHRETLLPVMQQRTSELALVPVKSWNPVDAVDLDWPDDQLPAIIVAAGRTDGDPVRDGSGTYRVPYRVEVAVVVSSAQRRRARRNAAGHAVAVETILANRLRAESTHVQAAKFVGGLPGVVPLKKPRDSTVASYQVAFDVVVPDALNDLTWPAEPAEDPSVPPDSTSLEIVDADATTTRT